MYSKKVPSHAAIAYVCTYVQQYSETYTKPYRFLSDVSHSLDGRVHRGCTAGCMYSHTDVRSQDRGLLGINHFAQLKSSRNSANDPAHRPEIPQLQLKSRTLLQTPLPRFRARGRGHSHRRRVTDRGEADLRAAWVEGDRRGRGTDPDGIEVAADERPRFQAEDLDLLCPDLFEQRGGVVRLLNPVQETDQGPRSTSRTVPIFTEGRTSISFWAARAEARRAARDRCGHSTPGQSW